MFASVILTLALAPRIGSSQDAGRDGGVGIGVPPPRRHPLSPLLGLAPTHDPEWNMRNRPPEPTLLRYAVNTIDGPMALELARRVIRRQHASYVACARGRVLPNVPAVRFQVRMTVGTDGRVSGVAAEESSGVPRRLAACMIRALAALQFPRSDGAPSVVHAPFTFAYMPP